MVGDRRLGDAGQRAAASGDSIETLAPVQERQTRLAPVGFPRFQRRGDRKSVSFSSHVGDGNSLSGPIPGELGDLSALRLLMLDRNDLSGTIPPRLGELSALTWLNLNDNDLSGPIPAELGDLSNLEHLYLHGNGLTGPVPADLGSLTNLTNLWLRDNRLSGQIPPSLGDLPNLQRVRIRGNAFTGCIPSGLLGGPGRYSDAEELGLPACVNDNVVGTP